MKTLYFESGEVVFEAGSLSDYAYLIEEGKFEVSRLCNGQKQVIGYSQGKRYFRGNGNYWQPTPVGNRYRPGKKQSIPDYPGVFSLHENNQPGSPYAPLTGTFSTHPWLLQTVEYAESIYLTVQVIPRSSKLATHVFTRGYISYKIYLDYGSSLFP